VTPLTLHAAAKVPRCQYAIPPCLYGEVIFMPITIRADNIHEWIRWHGMSYFWTAINFTTQILFIIGVHDASKILYVGSSHPDCTQLSPFLLAVGLFACTVAVLTDVQETWDLMKLLRKHIPTVPETSVLRFAEDEGGDLKLQSGGFSMVRKVCICVFILFPKLLLAAFLLVYAYCLLAVSESDFDIILNATALMFIIELDEMLYAYFSLPEVRVLLETIPPFVVGTDPAKESLLIQLRPIFQLMKFAVACALTGWSISAYKWCGNENGSWMPFFD